MTMFAKVETNSDYPLGIHPGVNSDSKREVLMPTLTGPERDKASDMLRHVMEVMPGALPDVRPHTADSGQPVDDMGVNYLGVDREAIARYQLAAAETHRRAAAQTEKI